MTEIERVQKLMSDLITTKKAQLADIAMRLDELKAEEESVKAECDAAAAALDEDAYAVACEKLKKINSKSSMYHARREQIAAQDYISEEESEKTIDALIAYEDMISEEFEKAIIPHLDALAKIRGNYIAEIETAENALRKWTGQIRQTYYNRNGSSREVDGKRTNRFDTPQPIRFVPYLGSKASGALGTMLDTVKRSME